MSDHRSEEEVGRRWAKSTRWQNKEQREQEIQALSNERLLQQYTQEVKDLVSDDDSIGVAYSSADDRVEMLHAEILRRLNKA